ncbi:hypothetical protein R3P38DRAFT_3065061 [Favolaschia claudopus]|uniref:Uncharacterized protein n=1 Tax=Favolaschia claudopus TaxID=2862362 RepID=A0AAW0A0V7_9AGAR
MSQTTDSPMTLSRAVSNFLRGASALQSLVAQWSPQDKHRELFEKCQALAAVLSHPATESVVPAPMDSYPAVASGAQILSRWPLTDNPTPLATSISPLDEMEDIVRPAAAPSPEPPSHSSPQPARRTEAEVLNLDHDVACIDASGSVIFSDSKGKVGPITWTVGDQNKFKTASSGMNLPDAGFGFPLDEGVKKKFGQISMKLSQVRIAKLAANTSYFAPFTILQSRRQIWEFYYWLKNPHRFMTPQSLGGGSTLHRGA